MTSLGLSNTDTSHVATDEVAPEGPYAHELICRVLRSVVAGSFSTEDALAREFETSTFEIEQAIRSIEDWGLARISEADSPSVTRPGEQFLARDGAVPTDTLEFVGWWVDDLNAREGLRRAGFTLIDEFVYAIEMSQLAEYVRDIVPPAFSTAVDEPVAARLFAAASALLARLGTGEPAGCVAEEVLTVHLLAVARDLIEEQGLGQSDVEFALSELSGVWELYQDDDVLQMFEMKEPSDAAVAGHDPINRQLGVADQRIEAWFEPFGHVVATGHLDRSPNYRWP